MRLQADNARAWDVFFSPSAYTASTEPILSALGQTRCDFDQITAITLQRIVAEPVLQPKGFKQLVY